MGGENGDKKVGGNSSDDGTCSLDLMIGKKISLRNVWFQIEIFCLRIFFDKVLCRTIASESAVLTSVVPDHLSSDVIGHFVVNAQFLPLRVEVGWLSVATNVPVQPCSHMRLDQVIWVNVQ